ncbi:MAG: hypothetical protein ABI877_02370 [Gemmatimonadaceae bacterium]
MNSAPVFPRGIRFALTSFLAAALAACSSDITQPNAPIPAPPAEARQAATYDCLLQSDIPFSECQTLVALYNSTNGGQWTNNTNWLQTSPCFWYGVICNSGVWVIRLATNNLTGTLPSSLGVLSHLTELFLPDNHLTGTIPSSLGSMTDLRELWLSVNQLTGGIPASLGSLTSLRTMVLANNQLTGAIPPSLGSLTSIEGCI